MGGETGGRLECKLCWYVYDPAVGDPLWQIAPGTAFADLPPHWSCPTAPPRRAVFFRWAMTDSAAPAEEEAPAIAARVQAAFELVRRERMGGLPFLNEALRVELCDWRNGYYHRNLVTSMGLVPDLRVPRLRSGVFKTTLFRRYQGRWRQVDRWIQGVFINGVSTREVSGVVRDLLGAQISASTVSAINKELDREVGLFHRRPIKDEYVYLFLDGIVKKVISCRRRVKKIILVAYGIRRDGIREVIDYRVALGESEREWYLFLHGLYQRGLQGALLRLIITDCGIGLRSALDMVYPLVERQRCSAVTLLNEWGPLA